MEPTPSGARGRSPEEKRRIARLAAFAVVVILIVAFVLANRHQVTVEFLVTSAELPMVWALVLAAVLGALADRLWRWQRTRHK